MDQGRGGAVESKSDIFLWQLWVNLIDLVFYNVSLRGGGFGSLRVQGKESLLSSSKGQTCQSYEQRHGSGQKRLDPGR